MKSKRIGLIVSSVICLLPMALSLAVYNDLPQRIAMQWDLDGNPNWYANKFVAAFGMPLFFVALNIFVRIFLNRDPKRENHSKVMRAFAAWIVPLISITVIPVILFMAMEVEIPVLKIVMVFTGIIFIFFGNYLNKSRQNYSIGIRVSWTLNDSDNWNKTHRMAGYLWMLGGILFIILSFLPLSSFLKTILILSVIALLIVIPLLYSYSLYKTNKIILEESNNEKAD